MNKSNVHIKSNVYPVKSGSISVANDEKFRVKVRGEKAIWKLHKLIFGGASHVDQVINDLVKIGFASKWLRVQLLGACSLAEGYDPHGLVRGEGGTLKVECRCSAEDCAFYRDCIL